MKRSNLIFRVLLSLAVVLLLSGVALCAEPYLKLTNGMGNMIFSDKRIGLHKEKEAKLAATFRQGDTIFGRVYFPRAFGRLQHGEAAYLTMYVNDRFAGRIKLGAIEPRWETMQIEVCNTNTSADFTRQLNELSSGTYKVVLNVMREGYMKDKYVGKSVDGGVQVSKQQVYKPVYLSKGGFSFIVP